MPGSLNLFDGQDLTALSESSVRNAPIRYLQIHHATMTSFSGLKALMDPGGRTVSANGAMSNEGYLDEVVLLSRRAFTSASSFDHQCLTVEVCNTSLSPTWGISEASRIRLAKLAVDMYRAGILGGLTRQFIIGHNEVPGTYATACPGPDMNLDHIVALANAIYNGQSPSAARGVNEGEEMFIRNSAWGDFIVSPGVVKHVSNGSVFNVIKQSNPAIEIVTVVDDNINAVIQSFSGMHPDNIPNIVPDGIWVNPKFVGSGGGTGGGDSADVIAEAVEKRLADDFAAIPAKSGTAAADEIKKRL